jgi:hypothetical protein
MEQRRCSHLLLFVIVWCRVRHDAPGALRGPFFHSGRVAAGGAFRGHLPVQSLSFPRCYSVSDSKIHSCGGAGINNRSYQCPRQLGGVVTLLLPVACSFRLLLSIVQSACCRLLVSVACSVSESRGLPRSHFLMPDRTSSIFFFKLHSLLHFAAGLLLSFLQTLRRYRSFNVSYRWLRKHCRRLFFQFMLDGHNGTFRLLVNSMSRPSTVDRIAGLFLRSSVGLFPHSINRILR